MIFNQQNFQFMLQNNPEELIGQMYILLTNLQKNVNDINTVVRDSVENINNTKNLVDENIEQMKFEIWYNKQSYIKRLYWKLLKLNINQIKEKYYE